MKSFEMALPKSVSGAVEASGRKFEDSKFLAGGTDLLGELKDRTQTPKRVVNLKTVPGLDQIVVTDDQVELGALVTLTEIAEHPEIQRMWPALAETLGKTATPNLRNVATLGGNLCQRVRCWYYRSEDYPCLKKGGSICYAQQGENEYHAIFDNRICCAPHPSNAAPALIAYDAKVEITGKRTRTMSISKFFTSPSEGVTKENVLKPNEVLTKVILSRASAGKNSAYVEVREKQSFDWALCGATAKVDLDGSKITGARIVLSAVSTTPERRKDLERMLVDQELSEELLGKVAERAVKGARPLEQNGYKVSLVKATVKRAIRQAVKG